MLVALQAHTSFHLVSNCRNSAPAIFMILLFCFLMIAIKIFTFITKYYTFFFPSRLLFPEYIYIIFFFHLISLSHGIFGMLDVMYGFFLGISIDHISPYTQYF
jgi:hypothetical protein